MDGPDEISLAIGIHSSRPLVPPEKFSGDTHKITCPSKTSRTGRYPGIRTSRHSPRSARNQPQSKPGNARRVHTYKPHFPERWEREAEPGKPPAPGSNRDALRRLPADFGTFRHADLVQTVSRAYDQSRLSGSTSTSTAVC